ncbi:hypothetical protein FACS1894120_0820 [Clostridia bacterium]|nr:hypothetical protein FACS1894120_0820 [Clostridia bacterium]
MFAVSKRIFLDSVDSTNTYLLLRADRFDSGDYAVAASQTAGRGRLGRRWENNGDGVRDRLFMSVLLKDLPASSDVTKYTLISAVAVRRAVFALCGGDVAIKWCNDILLRQGSEYRKIAGILCESRFSGGIANIVIGIGVNVGGSYGFYADRGYAHASSVGDITGVQFTCDEVENAVVRELYPLLDSKLGDVLPEYAENCVTIGRDVRVIRGGETVAAFAKALDEHGGLICENESGRFTVSSGEVSVRGAAGYI